MSLHCTLNFCHLAHASIEVCSRQFEITKQNLQFGMQPMSCHLFVLSRRLSWCDASSAAQCIVGQSSLKGMLAHEPCKWMRWDVGTCSIFFWHAFKLHHLQSNDVIGVKTISHYIPADSSHSWPQVPDSPSDHTFLVSLNIETRYMIQIVIITLIWPQQLISKVMESVYNRAGHWGQSPHAIFSCAAAFRMQISHLPDEPRSRLSHNGRQ